MTAARYLRYPHIQGDLLTFVADDDVWLALAEGGGAWRLSAEGASVSYPRLSPDARTVAWTTNRDDASEIYVAGVDGSGYRRLTYWGDGRTRVTGWTDDGRILAISATGQPARFLTWAHAVPVTGGAAHRLEFGPAGDITAHGPVTVLLTSTQHEPAHWKRYRGGTSGRLWVRDGGAGQFTRILAGLPGQVTSPMLAGGRVVFLSDHEGTGNLYSCDLDGSGLRLAHRPRRFLRPQPQYRRHPNRLSRGRRGLGPEGPGRGAPADRGDVRVSVGGPRPAADLGRGSPGQLEL